jgi:hypothetical protein
LYHGVYDAWDAGGHEEGCLALEEFKAGCAAEDLNELHMTECQCEPHPGLCDSDCCAGEPHICPPEDEIHITHEAFLAIEEPFCEPCFNLLVDIHRTIDESGDARACSFYRTDFLTGCAAEDFDELGLIACSCCMMSADRCCDRRECPEGKEIHLTHDVFTGEMESLCN